MIDLILTIVTDVKSLPFVSLNSDHRLVIGKVKLIRTLVVKKIGVEKSGRNK